MKNISFLLIPFFVLAGCASSTPDRKLVPSAPSDASIEAKQVAAQESSSTVAELKFSKASSEISIADAEKLNRLVETAKKKGDVKRALFVVWADEEMPADRKRDLDKTQIALADQRSKRLEDYFKKHFPEMKTETVNMAKRSGKVAEFLKTKEARIQESLLQSGVPTDAKKDGTAVSKAGRAIAILKVKDQS